LLGIKVGELTAGEEHGCRKDQHVCRREELFEAIPGKTLGGVRIIVKNLPLLCGKEGLVEPTVDLNGAE
jgi:hypothetical protein